MDSLLDDKRGEGIQDWEGCFTVDREKALEKLSGWQLPFKGAWIVKAVQAIVASGAKEPVTISQTWKETTINFVPGRVWTAAEVVAN